MTKQDFDFTETLKKYGGNEKIARELIATFLQELSLAHSKLNQACKEKNREKMSDILHQLKGSCGILGLTQLRISITQFYESTLNPHITFDEMADQVVSFNEMASKIMVYQKDFPKNASA